MKRIAALLSKHLSVPRDRSNPKLVIVEEDIIVPDLPRTMRRVREIIKCFKIILVFDNHTRNATTTKTIRRRRIIVKGIWCGVDFILKMVQGGFAFFAIDLPKAVLSKKWTKTTWCQQVIPQAGPGGSGPIRRLVSSQTQARGVVSNLGGSQGGLTSPSHTGSKREAFFHRPSCEVSS
jgi:hypothetical protein